MVYLLYIHVGRSIWCVYTLTIKLQAVCGLVVAGRVRASYGPSIARPHPFRRFEECLWSAFYWNRFWRAAQCRFMRVSCANCESVLRWFASISSVKSASISQHSTSNRKTKISAHHSPLASARHSPAHCCFTCWFFPCFFLLLLLHYKYSNASCQLLLKGTIILTAP